jgi:FKBP-type peptidyl-prolyl cis-trans isomerase FklB
MGQYQRMQKPLTAVVIQLMAAGALLIAQAPAQQSSSTNGQSTSTAKTGAAKASTAKKTTGAKTTSAYTLKTQKEKGSYALGMSVGLGLHRQGVDVDSAIVARGLRDAMLGRKTLMTEDEMRTALQQLRADTNKQQEAKAQSEGAANRKQGEEFLAANKAKPGVTTLPDGLQYKVLKEGTGPKPTVDDTVTVNYRGTLIDGKEFDSSYKRGQPTTFPVGGVIKGWTEALQLMPVGSTWELFIPPDLAYGDRGAGAAIAPGSTLIFEVELLSIDQKKQ